MLRRLFQASSSDAERATAIAVYKYLQEQLVFKPVDRVTIIGCRGGFDSWNHCSCYFVIMRDAEICIGVQAVVRRKRFLRPLECTFGKYELATAGEFSIDLNQDLLNLVEGLQHTGNLPDYRDGDKYWVYLNQTFNSSRKLEQRPMAFRACAEISSVARSVLGVR